MKEQTKIVVTMFAVTLLWSAIFLFALVAMVKIGDVRDDIHSLGDTIESAPSRFADIKIKQPDHRPHCTCRQHSDIALTDFVKELRAKGESSLGWMLLWTNAWMLPLLIVIVRASINYGKTVNAAFPKLTQKESAQFMNEMVVKTLVCPAGIIILILPFLLLAILYFIGRYVELTVTHRLIFSVVSALLVFLGIMWLTVTKGAEVRKAMDRSRQQPPAGDAAKRTVHGE